MKFKRVKDKFLEKESSHTIISGIDGKTIIVTALDFFTVVQTSKLNKTEAVHDNVALFISKKTSGNVVLALGEFAIGGAATPLYISSDEELIIKTSGNQGTQKYLNYLVKYEELENA
ncbi:hypothetical protein [Campylobacter sp. RM16187]|uniref:hypothetical protein n=1 Tax=Campylobacter sp. RM16187 TaxID=1660063 RepID=UPI0021B5B5ED|nr:hypothetical protein [Campylobacter sp. RM16187]QKG29195.1 hypothetical protein CDOMF_0932 [Campylobacter sp. RM16187]